MPPNTQNVDQGSGHHKDYYHPYQQRTRQRGFHPSDVSFWNQLHSEAHSNRSSHSVILQDYSANLRLGRYEETEYPAFGFQPPPSSESTSQWQIAEESVGTTLQDSQYFSPTTGGIVNTDQQNINICPGYCSYTRAAAMFERVHNFRIENAPITNIGQQYINHQHANNHGNHGLHNLKEFVSFCALHDSSAQDPERCCHPGTRESVLRQICNWTDDPTRPERILWLHGPAGVGKSAIAQTVSNLYDRSKIGAAFFFFRSDPMRNDGNRLFPTLAWRLALSEPIIKDHIAFSLEEDPDIPRKVIEAQFEQLIAQSSLIASSGELAVSFTRVIIIDGLDECSDLKLQDRILKCIGNAVTDTRFPLRFLVSSRPEANIQDFFDQFQSPTLQIDLANVENAFRDVETYITSEFARTAVEQELESISWPGQDIIDTLVSKSSGQFIYATTVIKYVGDKYESAVAQLDVILGLKPSNGKSPFSELDALYREILQRQPDQNFLQEFLPVLVASSMLSGVRNGNLQEDDGILLGLDETLLRRKLRGMHSVLKFKPFIDIHHKSFLDFLDDPSRSGEYHVSKQFANKRYIQRIVDLLVKAASDCHRSNHFQPRFSAVIKHFPFPIELSLDDLEEILRPLQSIQDSILQSPLPWKSSACNECWTFYMIDDLLLHLSWFRETTQLPEPKYVGIRPLTEIEGKQSIPRLDLDICLSLLLADLRGMEVSLNVDTIGLVRALVRFDPTKAAMKIRSRMDAQNLVDLIFCLNQKGCFKSWFGASAQNATRLALAIDRMVSLIPRPLLLNNADLNRDKRIYQGRAFGHGEDSARDKCFHAFFLGCLSHDNLVSSFRICSIKSSLFMVSVLPENVTTITEWRQSDNFSVSNIQQIFFEIAKATQYLRSLDVVVYEVVCEGPIYVDSDNHPKMLDRGFPPIGGRLGYGGYNSDAYSSEIDMNWFGRLFSLVLYGPYTTLRLKEPEIPDNLWQLIQWCCAYEREKRPTVDQVVQEMESWILFGQFAQSSCSSAGVSRPQW